MPSHLCEFQTPAAENFFVFDAGAAQKHAAEVDFPYGCSFKIESARGRERRTRSMISSRAAGRVLGFAHCLPPRRSRHFVKNGWRPRGYLQIRPLCRQRCGFGMELLTWKVHSVHQLSDKSDSPNGIPMFCACITTPQMGLFTLFTQCAHCAHWGTQDITAFRAVHSARRGGSYRCVASDK